MISSAWLGSKRSTSTPGGAGGGHHPEPAVEPVDVKEREDQQHHVVGCDDRRLDAADVKEVGEQCAVRQHRALGRAGRARGVEQHRQVLTRSGGVDRAGRRTWSSSIGEVDGARATGRVTTGARRRSPAPARTHAPLQCRQVGAGDDGHPSAAVAEQMGHLAGGVGRVDRHDHETGPKGPVVGDGEFDDVAEHDRDPVARLEAQPAQRRPPSGRRRRPARSTTCFRGRRSAPARRHGLGRRAYQIGKIARRVHRGGLRGIAPTTARRPIAHP